MADGPVSTREVAARAGVSVGTVSNVLNRPEIVAELPAGHRPTAMFCASDLLALGALQEMTARRILVPDSIAIVGYDDIDFAAAAGVP